MQKILRLNTADNIADSIGSRTPSSTKNILSKTPNKMFKSPVSHTPKTSHSIKKETKKPKKESENLALTPSYRDNKPRIMSKTKYGNLLISQAELPKHKKLNSIVNKTPTTDLSLNDHNRRNMNYSQKSTTISKQTYHSNDAFLQLSSNRASSNQETISINALLGNINHPPVTVEHLKLEFPGYESSKYSVKSNSNVTAYSANTYQGIVRNYNEDRVAILLNITKPDNFVGNYWPKISYFAIYDGHGGSNCADFLRDNLHNYIINEKNIVSDTKKAIRTGFQNCENDFLKKIALNREGNVVDRSGSCAIVCLIIDSDIFIANVGDSRSIVSSNFGERCSNVTIDHKPDEENEIKRIERNGGKIYRTQTLLKNIPTETLLSSPIKAQIVEGPYRVFPGRLSVSRTFGDVEAKLPEFGGSKDIVVPIPDIFELKIDNEIDFIMICSDGIFDQLSNKEVSSCFWSLLKDASYKSVDIHTQCGLAIDLVIKSALSRKTLDNVTCVMIGFKNLENSFNSPELVKFDIENCLEFNRTFIVSDIFKSESFKEIENKNFTRNRSLYLNKTPSRFDSEKAKNRDLSFSSRSQVKQTEIDKKINSNRLSRSKSLVKTKEIKQNLSFRKESGRLMTDSSVKKFGSFVNSRNNSKVNLKTEKTKNFGKIQDNKKRVNTPTVNQIKKIDTKEIIKSSRIDSKNKVNQFSSTVRKPTGSSLGKSNLKDFGKKETFVKKK